MLAALASAAIFALGAGAIDVGLHQINAAFADETAAFERVLMLAATPWYSLAPSGSRVAAIVIRHLTGSSSRRCHTFQPLIRLCV
jgi:hypothetical protein